MEHENAECRVLSAAEIKSEGGGHFPRWDTRLLLPKGKMLAHKVGQDYGLAGTDAPDISMS